MVSDLDDGGDEAEEGEVLLYPCIVLDDAVDHRQHTDTKRHMIGEYQTEDHTAH